MHMYQRYICKGTIGGVGSGGEFAVQDEYEVQSIYRGCKSTAVCTCTGTVGGGTEDSSGQ